MLVAVALVLGSRREARKTCSVRNRADSTCCSGWVLPGDLLSQLSPAELVRIGETAVGDLKTVSCCA